MTNEVIFYTQVISIVAFIIALFVLYRILVEQKNATIEFLKEIISDLKSQINKLENEAPDVLLERITKRATLLNKELSQLSNESEEDKQLITEKENELKEISEEILHYKEKLAKAMGLMTEHFCPICKESAITIRTYYPVFGYASNGKEIESDAEYVEYECGYSLRDGVEESPCAYSN